MSILDPTSPAADFEEALAAAGPRDVAVVGMAGRFPGARDLAQFWRNLRDGVEAVTFLSDEELMASGVPASLLAHPSYVKAASLLDDVSGFDAPFFGYNAHDAALLDPQQRLFLEHCWAALEDAGHAPGSYPGLIGVYAGVAWNTYLLTQLASRPELFTRGGGFQVFISNDKDFMSTRVSYKLNLKGPSLIVQTSCSTSLVAIHLACLSLLNYECDLALAGGVTVKVPQKEGYFYEDGGLASPDGHCRAFDAGAAGTIFGSGVGVVALKRLPDALADGDRIRAVVKGSAINNDGSVKVSYTAPSVEGQAEVIAAAQAVAGIDPETLGYVEAHGTGTALGDPIEVAALSKVFAAATEKRGFCALGSVKTNVGHLDAAAGIAGFLKTVLALGARQIPPSLHYERPNPAIDFAATPFHVAARLADWPAPAAGVPRRAGVSSFGVGGTNAHVILEEAPPLPAPAPSRPWQLLLLSARTETALAAATARLADHLAAHPDLPLADVAFTLAAGRTVFRHRRMLVANGDAASAANIAAVLASGQGLATAVDTQDPRERPVVFLFPGQGAQYPGMGWDLYQGEAVFRTEVDRCAEILAPHLGLDLRAVLYPPEQATAEAAARLARTALAQPALFTVEYALARLWMSWGVAPQAMLGHSVGEWVAACLAGVFSLEDALALVAERGQLMDSLPAGAMTAVPLSEADLVPLLGDRLALAAVNEPERTVASGPEDAVLALEQTLAARGIECRRLHTSHAFHSAAMEPALAPFAARVRERPRQRPNLPYLSNVSGTWITAGEAEDPEYWARQLRSTVRFADAVTEVLADPERILLEVGPGQALATLARRRAEGRVVLSSLRRPDEPGEDLPRLLTALGRLALAGVGIDWNGFFAGERRRRVPLPTYPFEHQQYWIEGRRHGVESAEGAEPAAATPGKRTDLADWFYVPSWRSTAPPRPATLEDLAENRRQRWLVLADDRGLGEGLAARLAAAGKTVTTVVPGAGFARLGEGAYALDPTAEEGYGELLREMTEAGGPPDAVIHAWSVAELPAGAADGAHEGVAAFEAAQAQGFGSLVALARVLAGAPTELWVLTSGVHGVTGASGSEPLAPERATILGPCRVIPQELPEIALTAIDVALLPGGRVDAALVERVLGELAAGPSPRLLAYRDGRRWEQAFDPLPLPAPARPLRTLRENGVYLITGGLAGVGFGLASELARTARARLILLEPADDGIPEIAETAERRRRELEAAGAEVALMTVDWSDPAAIAHAVAEGIERFGALHGAIHAAGIVGERTFLPLSETGPAERAWHFAPKAHALYALDEALAGRALDFRIAASSLAAVLGGLGYAAYAGANLFLDAFVQERARGATPWIGISWDAWQLGDAPLGEVEVTAMSAGLAELALAPAEGGEAFRRILAAATAEQVVISTGDLAARIAAAGRRAAARRGQETATADAADTADTAAAQHSRPPLAVPYAGPETELERAIAAVWQRTLGFDRVGVDDNFFELGGDSFIAVRMASELKAALAMDIPVAKLYQGLTVRALAALLASGESAEERLAAQLALRKESMDRRKEFQERRRSAKRERR
jgi:phthiocerol/phenolphthiocerol synthesis type-I polyketide synthase E